MSRIKCYRSKNIHNFKPAEIKSNKPENPEKYTSKQQNMTAKKKKNIHHSNKKIHIRIMRANFKKG